MIGTQLSHDKHFKCPFGTYVQTHEEGSNNTETERTIDAICLGTTGNVQGSYKFLNLATNRRIYRNFWTEVPAPDWVIRRVNDLGRKDSAERELVFKNRRQEVIEDDDGHDDEEDDTEEGIADDGTPDLDEGVITGTQNVDTSTYTDRDIQATQNRIFRASQHEEEQVPEDPEINRPSYADAARPSPTMERHEPGSVRTEAPGPRIKLESAPTTLTEST